VKRGVIFGLNNLSEKGFVVTQGTFDGVHKGHRSVLKQVVERARVQNTPSMLITFHPHPRTIVQPKQWNPQILNSIEEKSNRVLQQGIDVVLVLEFTKEIALLSPEEFVRKVLLEAIGVKEIVVGYDHRFGHKREGNFELLKILGTQNGFGVTEITAKEIDDIAISSTRIRKNITDGNLLLSNELLGYSYPVSGTVIHGEKKGREIGFPTANIDVEDPLKLIPPIGVYFGMAAFDDLEIPCMINIGKKPTVGDFPLSVEAHLLDYKGDLYDKRLELRLMKYHRAEKKFESLQSLIQQLHDDQKDAVLFFDPIHRVAP
jgi:riboflavin kinase/FMN adenylyltransferase